MKQYIKFSVAAVIALTLTGVAQAKDYGAGGEGCSNATLDGLYIFTASGFTNVSGVAQPKAIVELITFNGDGTITGGAATVSLNGTILHSLPTPPGMGGTYTLGADCIGTLQFSGPPKPAFDLQRLSNSDNSNRPGGACVSGFGRADFPLRIPVMSLGHSEIMSLGVPT